MLVLEMAQQSPKSTESEPSRGQLGWWNATTTAQSNGATPGLNADTSLSAYPSQIVEHEGKTYVALTGNAASGVSQIRVTQFNGELGSPSWAFLENSFPFVLNKNSKRNALDVSLKSFNGKLYATWREENESSVTQIRFAVYDSSQGTPGWTFLDGGNQSGINKDPNKSAYSPKFAIHAGKLYATWGELGPGPSQIRVAVYNGNDSAPAWAFVDGGTATGLNRNTSRLARWPELISFNSKLYLTWSELSTASFSSERIRARVYNGNDSSPTWTLIDGNGTNGINKAAYSAFRPKFFELNGKLYATWEETDSSSVKQVRVRVYNGNDASPAWTFVDGNSATGLNKNTSYSANNIHAAVYGTKLYLSWTESDDVTYTPSQVRFLAFNGNDITPLWTFLDGNGSTGIAQNTLTGSSLSAMSVSNSQLFVGIAQETTSSVMQAHVAVYNGNDAAPDFSFVHSNVLNSLSSNKTLNSFSPSLSTVNSKLYAAWMEDEDGSNMYGVRVAVSSNRGLSWDFVDGGGTSGIKKDPGAQGFDPKLYSFGSKLYATWMESGSTQKVHVAVYGGNDQVPAWTFVDSAGPNGINRDPAVNGRNPTLRAFNTKLYATWTEGSGAGQVRVAVYSGNDSSPAWAFVDGNSPTVGINRDSSRNALDSTLVELQGKLYAVWREFNGTSTQIRVAVYNGNDLAPSWTFVDGGGPTGLNRNPASYGYYPNAAVVDSKLYLTWSEGITDSAEIRVIAYNGNDSSPSWSFVDGDNAKGINLVPTINASKPFATEHNGFLHVCWSELGTSRCARYNGNDGDPEFEYIGSNTYSWGLNWNKRVLSSASPTLLSNGSNLYLATEESGGILVLRYGYP